jgi:hypothetical protein
MTTHTLSRTVPSIARAIPTAVGWWKQLASAWESQQQTQADRGIEGFLAHERAARARFLARARDHHHRERLQQAWDRPPYHFRDC